MPFLMAPTAYMFIAASRGNTKISKNPVASSANSYGAFLGMVISMQDNFQRYFDQALNLLCKNEMSQAEKNLSVGLITTKANVMFSLAEITNSWQKLPGRGSLADFGGELQQLLEALNSLVEWLKKEMEKVFDTPSTIPMYVYAQLLATTLGNVNKFLNFFRVELQDRYIKDTQLDMFKLLTVTEHLMADFSRRIPAINLMLKNEKNEEEEKTEFYRMKEAVERLDGECKRLYKQNEGLSQQLQKTQYKLEKANDKILIGKGTVRAAKQTIAQSNLQKSQLIVLTEELQQKNEEIAKLNIQLVDGMMKETEREQKIEDMIQEGIGKDSEIAALKARCEHLEDTAQQQAKTIEKQNSLINRLGNMLSKLFRICESKGLLSSIAHLTAGFFKPTGRESLDASVSTTEVVQLIDDSNKVVNETMGQLLQPPVASDDEGVGSSLGTI